MSVEKHAIVQMSCTSPFAFWCTYTDAVAASRGFLGTYDSDEDVYWAKSEATLLDVLKNAGAREGCHYDGSSCMVKYRVGSNKRVKEICIVFLVTEY
jgi:hypothetical protein